MSDVKRVMNKKKLVELLELLNELNVSYYNDGKVELKLQPTGKIVDATMLTLQDAQKMKNNADVEFLHAYDEGGY